DAAGGPAGGVRQGGGGQPDRRLPGDGGGGTGHARAGRRGHHQHLLGGRDEGRRAAVRVRGQQVGGPRDDPLGRVGAGAVGDPGERHLARRGGHADDRGR